MSATPVSAEQVAILYTEVYCIYAICGLLIYDWFLCLGQEVRLIWRWRSGITVASMVYAFNRYPLLITSILAIRTNYPMSDLSCKANLWIQTAAGVLDMIAFGTFSALRAYALSNRNIWLTAIIILLALPPSAMTILQGFYEAPANLPSPFNCTSSTSLSRTLYTSINIVWRVSQFAAELLVISITWWYTYQSYRIRKGIKLEKTLSSLLIYNGSLYFLFLATLYILSIILNTAPVPGTARNVTANLAMFYDPIASILTSRFMLLLRQYDSANSFSTDFGAGSRLREQMTASTVLQFAAQTSDRLPTLIVSFAHPVHVDSSLSGTDSDAFDDVPEWREMDVVAPTWDLEDAILPESDS